MLDKEKKTKKQHYVPRCYLEAWAMPGTYQVHVYDKTLDVNRINSIKDVASENYFYDVIPNELFTKDILSTLQNLGPCFKGNDRSQGIEKVFANEVEGPFSELLRDVIGKANAANLWVLGNCFFISQDDKGKLAAYLAMQFVRTKQVRNQIINTADCLNQALIDMGASEDTISKYSLSRDESKNLHVTMLMDVDHLSEIALSFLNLTWILCVNRTAKKFYTSDSPIGTKAHIECPPLSMSGLKSKGVEAFFPISPDLMLVMFDGSYHSHLAHLERRYVQLSNEAYIDYYNSLCALLGERCIFSSDGDFALLEKMKQDNPLVFTQPHTQLSWGGKKYYPTK